MDGSRYGIDAERTASPPPGRRAELERLLRALREAFDQARQDISLWYRDQDDDEFPAQLRAEQLREIGRRVPANAIASAFCALLLLIAVWERHNPYLLLSWSAAIWLISAAGLRQWRHLRKRDGYAIPSVGTMRKTAIQSAVLGGLWGVAGLILTRDGLVGGEVLGLLVTTGMAAGAAVSLASLPQSSFAFVLTSLLPCSLGFALNASLPYIAISIAILVFAAYLIHVTYSTYLTLVRLLRARVHQNRLSMALSRSQEIAEEAYREIEDDLMTARRAQLRVMPKPDQLEALWEKTGVRVEAHFEPCMHLGGDHWSIVSPEPHIVRFCVSDFAGHGISAALNSFKLVALLARMTEAVMRPNERAKRLNQDLCRVLETGQYATVLLGEINVEKSELSYVGCGGPAPMVFRSGQTDVFELNTKGLPMGISTEAKYEERKATAYRDQLLLIFSDALTEALDDDDAVIGSDWVRETAQAHINSNGFEGTVDALIAEFRKRTTARLADDLTVIAMWYDPQKGPAAIEGATGS